jgi:hypothetical protein
MICKHTVEQHIFIYNSYAKSDSARVCQRIKKNSLVLIFLQGLLDKKIKRRCHTLSEEKLDDIGARLDCQENHWQN